MLSPEPTGRVRAPTRTRTPRVPPATPARVERASWLAPSRSRDALLSWGARCVRECGGIGRREPETSFSRVAAGRRPAARRLPISRAGRSRSRKPRRLGTPQRAMENVPMGAMELQPAGPGHPCKRMRLGGRQNNMPEEFCMASTCVLPPRSPRWRRTNVLRAYLKWTALRLSLTRLARPSRIRKQQERETVQQTQGRNLRVTVLPGPPRGTTQTPCASHPAKTSHATRHRKDPLLALRKVSFF